MGSERSISSFSYSATDFNTTLASCNTNKQGTAKEHVGQGRVRPVTHLLHRRLSFNLTAVVGVDTQLSLTINEMCVCVCVCVCVSNGSPAPLAILISAGVVQVVGDSVI